MNNHAFNSFDILIFISNILILYLMLFNRFLFLIKAILLLSLFYHLFFLFFLILTHFLFRPSSMLARFQVLLPLITTIHLNITLFTIIFFPLFYSLIFCFREIISISLNASETLILDFLNNLYCPIFNLLIKPL